jgi:hypothetical protein
MTAPETEAAPSDCAWLRTNPAALPKSTPKTFKALITGGNDVWLQVYKDWLVGTTNGTPNAPRVVPGISGDELVRWFGQLAAAPGKADSDKPDGSPLSDIEKTMVKALGHAPAPVDKVRSFELVYGSTFVTDVDTVRTMVDARVKQLRDEAKAAGKPMSGSDALKQAGKEAQRLTLANAAASEGKVLDVGVALVIQVQLEKYKATSLQLFNTSLNQIADTQWDTEEGGGGDKAEAERVMGASGTAVLTAAARLKDVSDRLKKPRDIEALTPAELETALFDAMIEFTEAIAKQGDAMTRTGRLIAKWAQRATKMLLKENFDTVYPALGGALLGLRIAVSVSQAVLDFFPPFNTIGTVLNLSDQALEFGIKELMVWRDSQKEELQQKYAGKTFVIDRAKLNVATRAAVGITEFKENFEDKIDEYTFGLPAKGVKAVVVPTAKALAAVAGAGESAQATVGRNLNSMVNFADEHKEAFVERVSGVAVPLSLDSVISTLGSAVPGMGIAMTVKTVVFDIASFTTAQVKELQNQTGLSDQDVEDIKALMKDKSANPFHSAFAAGELQLEPKEPGAAVTYARVSGIRLRITHGPDARVDNADPGTVDKNIKHLAMKSLNDKVVHEGRHFVLDWTGFVALTAEHQHPSYFMTVPATVAIGGTTFDVTVKLAYDMELDDARALSVDGDLPVDAVAQKMAARKQSAVFEPSPGRAAETTVTIDDIEGAFTGRVVEFNGETYTLTGKATGGLADSKTGTVDFSMNARAGDNSAYRIDLRYHAGAGLEVDAVEALPDFFEERLTGGELIRGDDIQNRFQGAKIGFTHGDLSVVYVLDSLTFGPSGGKGAPLAFHMSATSDSGGAVVVELSYTAEAGLEVTKAKPSPVMERVRRAMDGQRRNILTGAKIS